MSAIIKVTNSFLDLMIWVGLWNSYENIIDRFNLSKNIQLLVFISTILLSYLLIYLVNNKIGFVKTMYD